MIGQFWPVCANCGHVQARNNTQQAQGLGAYGYGLPDALYQRDCSGSAYVITVTYAHLLILVLWYA